ncbi:P-type conjugative transfer protein TrbJ [Novosphingobium rosa]|uniref:P-type conjugative transfer protein TrbJ n=1 Tax=Novosphingobium rosa TaxID=76978 RepID=UPI00083042CB|nr:P-type conjugative transfer protein TrbJ [Novosphingobium rosa]
MSSCRNQSPRRGPILTSALALSMVLGSCFAAAPAQAQWTVFDPTNYSQNILTAARTLQQINNQITMLQNQAKHLLTMGFPELSALSQTMQSINSLMSQAQSLEFKVANIDKEFSSMFPTSFNQALTMSQHVTAARSRMDASMAAFKQTMTVQAQIVENVSADASNLSGIVDRSQSAQGSLQATQATNQLLALIAKQQFQIQNLMAAQYHAEALDKANRTQSQSDAQSAVTQFLGSGSAYTTP